MEIPEFASVDTLRKLWWLHDSFWHAALVKELGFEQANRLNLEAGEKIFRMMTNQLLREKMIKRPRSIQDLMPIFRAVWKNAFFDGLYIDEPVTYKGNTAVWIGSKCHAYEAVRKGRLLDGYECGCQAVRNGVMKALRLKPLHFIKESLVKGDGRCVVVTTFVPITSKKLKDS
jgi:hypothetical protein